MRWREALSVALPDNQHTVMRLEMKDKIRAKGGLGKSHLGSSRFPMFLMPLDLGGLGLM